MLACQQFGSTTTFTTSAPPVRRRASTRRPRRRRGSVGDPGRPDRTGQHRRAKPTTATPRGRAERHALHPQPDQNRDRVGVDRQPSRPGNAQQDNGCGPPRQGERGGATLRRAGRLQHQVRTCPANRDVATTPVPRRARSGSRPAPWPGSGVGRGCPPATVRPARTAAPARPPTAQLAVADHRHQEPGNGCPASDSPVPTHGTGDRGHANGHAPAWTPGCVQQSGRHHHPFGQATDGLRPGVAEAVHRLVRPSRPQRQHRPQVVRRSTPPRRCPATGRTPPAHPRPRCRPTRCRECSRIARLAGRSDAAEQVRVLPPSPTTAVGATSTSPGPGTGSSHRTVGGGPGRDYERAHLTPASSRPSKPVVRHQ